MTTLIAFPDVDDVDHWLTSPKREEVPDMDKFQEVMASDVAAEAMSFDGVHADTLVMLVES